MSHIYMLTAIKQMLYGVLQARRKHFLSGTATGEGSHGG